VRLKGRQAQFVAGTISVWILGRVIMLSVGGLTPPLEAPSSDKIADLRLPWPSSNSTYFEPSRGALRTLVARHFRKIARVEHAAEAHEAAMSALSFAPPRETIASKAGQQDPKLANPAVRAPSTKKHARLRGSSYLFVRPGRAGADLAGGGALGGSQAAIRYQYQLNPGSVVRTAFVFRAYTPLHGRGAEAAVGLDWHPLASIPVRLSFERRVALDHSGRDAWSAYAAGGFYTEPLRDVLVVDGYAQAGVVGLHQRAVFTDGAVRAGRRVAIANSSTTWGVGVWGAAQPGAARLDAGPRIAAVLSAGRTTISAAVEGRFRLAGHASPGSGAAMTLAVDF
jgi:hypothetical protein